VLQEGEVQRVGSDKPIHVNVRILTATNRDLAQEVAKGRFRADLYHRLDVFPLRMPPLRERRSDIAILAGFFLDRHRVQLGLPHVALTPAALAALEAGEWPGNVRELDHALARAVLRAKLRTKAGPLRIDATDIDPSAEPASGALDAARDSLVKRIARGQVSLRDAVEELKRDAVTSTLEETGGNWAEAARRLDMDRGNLHHMAQRLRISRR
jgi:anaerobic nitric oxide reductase transcription regulator